MLGVSKASCPASVRDLAKRFDNFQTEVQALRHSSASIAPGLGLPINVAPIVRTRVYREWFASRQQTIMAEITDTYKATMAAGYLWPDNIIADFQLAFQTVLDQLNALGDQMEQVFQLLLNNIPNSEEKQRLIVTAQHTQALLSVCNKTWKLLNPTDLGRVLLFNTNTAPKKMPVVPPPLTQHWQKQMTCPFCGSGIGYSSNECGNLFSCQCGNRVLLN